MGERGGHEKPEEMDCRMNEGSVAGGYYLF